MDPALIFKGAIVVLILAIFLSLTGGMVFLIRDQGESERTVKSLTVRVILSVTLFVMLIVGFATGLIKPHGLSPAQTREASGPAP